MEDRWHSLRKVQTASASGWKKDEVTQTRKRSLAESGPKKSILPQPQRALPKAEKEQGRSTKPKAAARKIRA